MLSQQLLAAIGESYQLLHQQKNLSSLTISILALLGKASEVDRVYIFKNHYDDSGDFCMTQKFEWVKDQIDAQIEFEVLHCLSWSHFPELYELLSKNKSINAFVRNSTNPFFKEAMTEQDIISYLFVPIFSGKLFWGFIGFDNCKKNKLFNKSQVSALHAFAATLGMEILARKERKRKKTRRMNFYKFINSLNEVLIKLSNEGKILFVNETWKDYTGFSVNSSLGKNLSEFVAPSSRPLLIDFLNEIKKNFGVSMVQEIEFLEKSGKSFWGRVNLKCNLSNNGYLTFSGNIININDVKTVSNQLKETNNLNQVILFSSSDIFYSQNILDNSTIFISPQIESLGFDPKMFYKDSSYWRSHIHPEDLPKYITCFKEIAVYGNVEITYRVMPSRGGDAIWIHEKAWMDKMQKHKLHGWVTNVTENKKNELRLQESEEKFRLISESSPNPIFIYDFNEKRLIYGNKAFRAIAKNNSDSFDISTLFPEGNEIYLVDILKNSKAVFHDRETLFGPKESQRWYNISVDPISLNGKELCLISLFDIHDRKIGEEKISTLNEMLEAINETQLTYFQSDDIYLPLDKLLDVILKITGSQFGFIGEVFFEDGKPYLKSHSLTNISWSKETAEFFKNNYRHGIEFRNLDTLFGYPMRTCEVIISNDAENDPRAGKTTPKGHPPIKRFLGIPVLKNNELIGLIGFANKDSEYTLDDVEFLSPIVNGYANFITAIRINRERKHAETQKVKSEQMYKFISENTADVIALHDIDSTFKFVSPSIEKVLGYSPHEIIGNRPSDIFGLGDSVGEFDQNQERMLVSHKYKGSEKVVQMEILRKVVNDENGNPSSFIAVGRDVTERERMFQKLKEALLREQELNKLKSRFISMISHEFRTPLATILSSSELLGLLMANIKDNILKDKTSLHLKRINAQVSRLTGVISDILILEKGVQNKLSISKEKILIKAFIKKLVEDNFSDAENHLKIRLSFPEEEKEVVSDPVWITHIFRNIIENAIKYSRKNTLIPELELLYHKNHFILNVRDYGIGIPKEDQKYVFGSFFRAKNVSNIKGTGLGLNIVNEFVVKLGGKVTFKSIEGEGTIFTVKMPYES